MHQLPTDVNATKTAVFHRILASFLRQGMMQQLGGRLLRVAPGECELALPYSERVTQQQSGFHGVRSAHWPTLRVVTPR